MAEAGQKSLNEAEDQELTKAARDAARTIKKWPQNAKGPMV
jgi:hypothetical protein